jgi:hypothetical protein
MLPSRLAVVKVIRVLFLIVEMKSNLLVQRKVPTLSLQVNLGSVH